MNYLLGTVLGEDDFRQSFTTPTAICGWRGIDGLRRGAWIGGEQPSTPVANEVKVRVEAGVALSPNGQLICVPEAQCAGSEWLAEGQ